MLLQQRITIEEQIVRLLAVKPSLKVTQIIKELEEKGFKFSQRGVYKELKKLEEEGVVLKVKNTYGLHLSWLINVLSFVDSAYDLYSKSKFLEGVLGGEEEKLVYHFTDVKRLDLFWIHLLSAGHNLFPSEPLFLWCPYQWFHLLHDYTVRLFYKASDLSGATRYHIMGGDNYINRSAISIFPKVLTYSMRPSPFYKEMDVYYSVVGDLLLTIKFDKAFNGRIEKLFSSVRSEKDLRTYDLNSVFAPQIRGKVVVEKNDKKVKRVKRKFKDFFGV